MKQMKKLLGLVLSICILLTLMPKIDVWAAYPNLKMNGTTSISVEPDCKDFYQFTLKEAGNFNLTTELKDKSNFWIYIYDADGNELIKDQGKWVENSITGNYVLSMPIQLSPADYYVAIENNRSTVLSMELTSRFQPIEKVTKDATYKVNLLRGETSFWELTAASEGYFVISTSNKEWRGVDFYLMGEDGSAIDDDDVDPDWKENSMNGNWTMKWQTKPISKGKYYLKLINETGGTLSTKVKIQTFYPATKVNVKSTKVTLKVGETYQITSSLVPKCSTDSIKYGTSNKKIATVSKSGLIKAKKAGKVTIKVKAKSGVSKKITVTVKKPVTDK